MRDPREVLIRPVMTEKTMREKEERNTVAFRVRPDANKVEIRLAVEAVFNVKVAAVRTASYEGKLKRMGVKPGWPDFIFVGPRQRMFFLELKRRGCDHDAVASDETDSFDLATNLQNEFGTRWPVPNQSMVLY